MKQTIFVSGIKTIQRVLVRRHGGMYVRILGSLFRVERRVFGWCIEGYVSPQFVGSLMAA